MNKKFKRLIIADEEIEITENDLDFETMLNENANAVSITKQNDTRYIVKYNIITVIIETMNENCKICFNDSTMNFIPIGQFNASNWQSDYNNVNNLINWLNNNFNT